MKKIIFIILVPILLAFVVAYFTAREKNVGAVQEYTVISWQKPTTDAGWAEDTKKEALDFRSNQVLDEMLASHSAKLAREIEAFKKFEACRDCIIWEKKEQLSSMLSGAELDAEATKAADDEIAQRKWSIEKLRQSVERMEKEIELRDKGYLIVGGSENLGGQVSENRIRYIHD